MKLIKPGFEVLEQAPELKGLLSHIERCARTCYKSEDKITEDSAEGMVNRLKEREHCYTGDTEVLTDAGWIKFREYKGERVATVTTDCKFNGFEEPMRVVSHTYKGNFYYYPALGIEVTDGHNMFGRFREAKNNFYNSNSYNLFKCNTSYKDNNGRDKTLGERMFKSPRHCLRPVSTDPYGELIGFWLGDGCWSLETKNKLVFHLKKTRKVEYLKKLCGELGYTFEARKSNYYTVTSNNIGNFFNSFFYADGKKIPPDYFPSIDIGHSIIQGLINSDGSLGVNTRTITFTSTSKSIINWLLMYAPLCGYTVSNRGVSHYSSANNPIYRLLLLDTDYTINNDSRNHDTKVIISNKVEKVYCVTVSTGLIVVRGTNGVTTICGNCAMLEHGTVYLRIPSYIYEKEPVYFNSKNKYKLNPYSVVNSVLEEGSFCPILYVTTNYRVLVENDWLDDLKYLCIPTEHHEKRISVKFICDRGVSHEFVRHRVFSFAQESTRYCNYSKDKFNKECTLIIPSFFDTGMGENSNSLVFQEWKKVCKYSEEVYNRLLENKATPQQARTVLPNSLKTELIMTGTAKQWEGFFKLRCANSAHPQARELAIPLRSEFIRRGYIKDIKYD